MKNKFLKIFLVLMLMSSFTQVVIAGEIKDIQLKTVSKLRPDGSYIFGSFFDGKIFKSVKMQLQNIDTDQNYIINFNLSKKLKIYPIPPGKYRIDSFWTKVDRASTSIFDKTYLKLEENEKLYEYFEINSGEQLYLGNYKTIRPVFLCSRTVKITRDNDFSKAEEYIKKFSPDLFNMKSLSETTIKLEPITFSTDNETNQNAFLAGRFITDRNDWSLKEIEIINLWTKEKLKIKFTKSTDVRLFPIKPGEYVINDINAGGHRTEVLLPESWLQTFLVKPGEVLYLGNLIYMKRSTLNHTTVTTSFLNDFDSSIQDITSLLGSNSDYKIYAIEAEEG